MAQARSIWSLFLIPMCLSGCVYACGIVSYEVSVHLKLVSLCSLSTQGTCKDVPGLGARPIETCAQLLWLLVCV